MALTRRVIRAYLTVWTDICQNHTQVIAHGNMPSAHHELTKLILFRGTRMGNCGHFKETCYYDSPAILL